MPPRKKRKLDHTGPVLQVVLPMPAELFASIGLAVDKVCESHGLECFFKETDGLGVIHVRPKGSGGD